jgi:hypothetical protein
MALLMNRAFPGHWLLSIAAALTITLIPVRGDEPEKRAAYSLGTLNDMFRNAYASSRKAVLASAGPVILVEGDNLVLVRDGKRTEARVIPEAYHALKAVSHVPLAAYVLLHPAGEVLNDETKSALRALRQQAAWAQERLKTEGVPETALGHQKEILSPALDFIDKHLKAGTVKPAELTAFARSMGPLLLWNAEEAARLELQGLDRQVHAWQTELPENDWRRLRVVVMGSALPRKGNLAVQYFAKLFNQRGESDRLVYTESVFDEGRALNILGTHLLDTAIGEAFFNDPTRMHRDLLADAAEVQLGTMSFGPLKPNERPTIDVRQASRFFKEAGLASEADGGRLWGKEVYGPLLFADPQTLDVVANRQDREGKLTPADDVYVGRLPKGTMVANMSMTWAGVDWAMVIWPPPQTMVDRNQLLLHESWHRIQASLGLPAGEMPNPHLDRLDGRYPLRLELRALQKALRSAGPSRAQAVADALTFRAARHERYPNSAFSEARLEVHEGLAEYTGVKLRGTSDLESEHAWADHLGKPPPENFTRTYAYLTGPAYGLLLDETSKPWRPGVTTQSDLTELLRKAMNITLSPTSQQHVETRAAIYGGTALLHEEQSRERERVHRHDDYLARLVKGPALELPLERFSMVMDPSGVMPLDEHGTVYVTLTLKDRWGTLKATKGVLIARDFKRAYVSQVRSEDHAKIEGDGWTLELNAGWKIAEGKRSVVNSRP